MSEQFIDTITDRDGDEIEVSVVAADVLLTTIPGVTCVVLDAERQERFAQAYVAACHQAKANAAQGRPADGMNKVERLARDLIGIPDGL